MLWLAASPAPAAEAPGVVVSAGCAAPAPVSPVEEPASVPDAEAWPAAAPVLAALVVSAVDPAADVLVAAPAAEVPEDEGAPVAPAGSVPVPAPVVVETSALAAEDVAPASAPDELSPVVVVPVAAPLPADHALSAAAALLTSVEG